MLLQNLGSSFYILILQIPKIGGGYVLTFTMDLVQLPTTFSAWAGDASFKKELFNCAQNMSTPSVFQASSIDIFDMAMSERFTAPGICKSTMVGALEAAARTNFSPAPTQSQISLRWPHNLRIVVEPPAPFLRF